LLLESLIRDRGIAILTEDELARYRRYLVPGAASTFLAARVFLRCLLSLYGGLTPDAWRFATNPWGRPYVANPAAPAGLRFNLSHKPRFVTCLVGWERELGVDVEDRSVERRHLLPIAQRFFSAREAGALVALPPPEQPDRFYQLWTLKESYIKARGRGLSLGLSRFSFTVEGSGASVRFDPGFPDDAGRWAFQLFRPGPEHVIATTIERVDGAANVTDQGHAGEVIRSALATGFV